MNEKGNHEFWRMWVMDFRDNICMVSESVTLRAGLGPGEKRADQLTIFTYDLYWCAKRKTQKQTNICPAWSAYEKKENIFFKRTYFYSTEKDKNICNTVGTPSGLPHTGNLYQLPLNPNWTLQKWQNKGQLMLSAAELEFTTVNANIPNPNLMSTCSVPQCPTNAFQLWSSRKQFLLLPSMQLMTFRQQRGWDTIRGSGAKNKRWFPRSVNSLIVWKAKDSAKLPNAKDNMLQN